MTQIASPNAIAFVFAPPSRSAAGLEDPRTVRSNLARFGLPRLVVIAAQGARMPAADRA